jgi:hypothetical protein
MELGLWYEMRIVDPIAYLFKNSDPRGSLAANVGSATVRSLSNLPLETLMSNRHEMSRDVRKEVSENSRQWGYQLGSCYIRKVDFRDKNMVAQIQGKVVSRLKQITAAIAQKGVNEVSIIQNTAEKRAAVNFGKAAAVRPKIVGELFAQISQDTAVSNALFQILESAKITGNKTPLCIIDPQISIIVTDTDKTTKVE